MSDASQWIVVLTHKEFPSTPQFVPVESVMRCSLWRVLGQSYVLGGILASMEPPVLSRFGHATQGMCTLSGVDMLFEILGLSTHSKRPESNRVFDPPACLLPGLVPARNARQSHRTGLRGGARALAPYRPRPRAGLL